MSTATPFMNGDTLSIRHADGTEESFAELKARAIKGLPEELRGDMERSLRSQNGNYQISFGDTYYVGNDSNASDAENERKRAVAIAKRFAVLGAIIVELAKAGLKPGEHYSPRDSYWHDRSKTWRSTAQLWINVNERAAAEPKVDSDETLMTKAMTLNPDAVDDLLENPRVFGEDGKLSTYGRAKLRAISARASAAETKAKTEQAKTDGGTDNSGSTDDMPVD